MRLGKTRRDLRGLLVVRNRFLNPARLREHIRQIVMRLGISRPETEGLFKVCCRVFDLDRLRDVFADVAGGTVAEGARLFVKVLPVRHHCQNCGCDFEASRADCPCPECRHPHTEMMRGEELRLLDVELDDNAA